MIEWLRVLVGVGIALGLAVTGLGRLAQWWPALDLVNNGLPALAAGAIALCVLAVVTRDWRAIALAGLLAAINVGLIVAGLAGAAAEAGPDAKRFLRVASFNLWFENERIDEVDTFLNQTDADVVMLQEVTNEHLAALHQGLDARYPYSVGDFGIVIFSKYAIKADGRVDRAGYPESAPPARAVGRARRARHRRRSGRRALRAALPSRVAGAGCGRAHAARADQDAADRRGGRLQPDAVGRSVSSGSPA